MSRYNKTIKRKENQLFDVHVAYGHDKITGYFFQVFDENTGEEEEDFLVLDECSTFSQMSKGRMVELMNSYKVNQEHIQLVALDLPI